MKKRIKSKYTLNIYYTNIYQRYKRCKKPEYTIDCDNPNIIKELYAAMDNRTHEKILFYNIIFDPSRIYCVELVEN